MKMSNILLATAAAAALLASPAAAFDDRLEPRVDAILREVVIPKGDVGNTLKLAATIMLYNANCDGSIGFSPGIAFTANASHVLSRLSKTIPEAKRKAIGSGLSEIYHNNPSEVVCAATRQVNPVSLMKDFLASFEVMSAMVVAQAKADK
jgi:hypothetical protein